MLPRVILHNSISLDGKLENYMPDVALHYEIVARWQADAYLAGSNTILKQEAEMPPEDEAASESPVVFEPPQKDPNDPRPLLIVPDSRGRVRSWYALRQAPYWRDCIALCSEATPQAYFDYLDARHFEYIVAGHDHVDLRAALEELSTRYGVKTVLLDSGGTLNGVMLRVGLVNHLSLLVNPCLVGGSTPNSFFRDTDVEQGVIQLKLTDVEQPNENVVWLQYDVMNETYS
jgi:2,5-diamino-6-(ribosylamino)-4(3H)-pyrimidinone 5'-phosphate reductase